MIVSVGAKAVHIFSFFLLLSACFGNKTALRGNHQRSLVEGTTECQKCTKILCLGVYHPLSCGTEKCMYNSLCEATCAGYSMNDDCEYVSDNPYIMTSDPNDVLQLEDTRLDEQYDPSNEYIIQTKFGGDKSLKNVMFDVEALTNIHIEGIKINIVTNGNLKMFIKEGSYVGYEQNNSAWTTVNINFRFEGPNEFSDVSFVDSPISISSGETYAFCFVLGKGITVHSTEDTGANNIISENNNIVNIYQGIAFKNNFNAKTDNAAWSGGFVVTKDDEAPANPLIEIGVPQVFDDSGCALCVTEICSTDHKPVTCGSNNCRYDNGCVAVCAGHDIATQCTFDTRDSNETPTKEVVEGTNAQIAQPIEIRVPQVFDDSGCALCVTEICLTDHKPVTCGSNNCTYNNGCIASCAGHDKAHCTFDSPDSNETPTKELVEVDKAPLASPIIDDSGCALCVDVFCMMVHEPMTCGSNKCKYDNRCVASCAGHEIATQCTFDLTNDGPLPKVDKPTKTCPEAICLTLEQKCNKSAIPVRCSGKISSGNTCSYRNHCEAICAGFSSSECEEESDFTISDDKCFEGNLSCNECLENQCAWAGHCLPSCDLIADVSCYDATIKSPAEMCEIVAIDKADSDLCYSFTEDQGCSTCTKRLKSNGEPCLWIESIGFSGAGSFCASEGGMLGEGTTVCADKIDSVEHTWEERTRIETP